MMGARMYDTETGRFTTPDLLWAAFPSHTPYHYAYNSPLIWSDPSGLAAEKERDRKKLMGEKLPCPGDCDDDLNDDLNDEVNNGTNSSQTKSNKSRTGDEGSAPYDLGEGGGNGSFVSGADFTELSSHSSDPLNRSIMESDLLAGMGPGLLNPGGESSHSNQLDVNNIYQSTNSQRVSMTIIGIYLNREVGFPIYRNLSNGSYRAGSLIVGGKGSITVGWHDYNPATEEFVAFDHLHLLNQPLEPFDFNWIGSGVVNYLLGNNPFNSIRQFILFATTIQSKNITTTYGHIYDAGNFASWYRNYYDKEGRGFYKWEQEKTKGVYIDLYRLFYINQFNNAFNEFQRRLHSQKSGVRYGKIK